MPRTSRTYPGSFHQNLRAAQAPGSLSEGQEQESSGLIARRGILKVLGLSLLVPLAPANAKDKDYNDCTKWEPGRVWITGKSCQEKGKVRFTCAVHVS